MQSVFFLLQKSHKIVFYTSIKRVKESAYKQIQTNLICDERT